MALTGLFSPRDFTAYNDIGPVYGGISGSALTAGDLVILTGSSAGVPVFSRASSAAVATARGLVAMTMATAAGAGQQIQVTEYLILRNIDTSAYALQGYAYMAPTGAFAATPGAVSVRVGICISVSATAGIVVLNPTNVTGVAAGMSNLGTDNDSWTTNLDATAGAAENPSLVLLGGDGGADLVRTDLLQDSTAETLTYRQRRTGVYISPRFNIGRAAETTASLGSYLNLYGTTATSVVRALNISCTGAAIGFVGSNLVDPAAANNNMVIATGNTAATLAANWASGTLTVYSGNTSQGGAFNNAVSGAVGLGSGDTSQDANAANFSSGAVTVETGSTTCGAAGGANAASGNMNLLTGESAQANAASAGAASGTWIGGSGVVSGGSVAGANSGNVSLRSGNVTDTGGGASGTAALFSGTSAVGNTGNVSVYTGAPTTVTATSGTLNLYTGAIGAGVGVSGNVAIATGNVGGAGTSGDITLTTGTTAAGTRGDITMTSDQINLRPVTDVNMLNDIPFLFGTTQQWRLEYDTGVGAPFRFILEGLDYGGTADTASSAFLCETGTTAPTTVVANTGNMTLRSGACTSVGAVNFGAGSTGAWVGGSGDTAQTTAAGIGQATGPVSLFSGASTVSFAAATGGTSGGWTGGSGACTTSVDGAGSGASGTVALSSGATLTRVAGTSPASGTVGLYSGATDSNNAGATAGVTGNVSVYSGPSTSTLGTSGATGTANLYTGASDDANTGIVNIYSGNAAGVGAGITSGGVNISSGTVGGTGTTGTLALASGAAVGAGTSGNITLTIGGTAAGTAGTIQSIGRHTTTDGVTGGAARTIGGMVYNRVVDSAPLASGTGAVGPTAIDSYTILADTIKAGTRVTFGGTAFVDVGGGAHNLTIDTILGVQVIATNVAADPADNTYIFFEGEIIGRDVPGAAAAVVHKGKVSTADAAAAAVTAEYIGHSIANQATDGNLILSVRGTWAAGAGGDAVLIRDFWVKIDG